MKKTLLLLALLAPLFLLAQNTEGTVRYKETLKMTINFPEGPEGDEMRKMIPPSQSFSQLFYFSERASLYREPEEKDDSEDMELNGQEGGMDMRIVMKRPQNRMYRDLDKGETIQSQEFMDRFFLIKGEAKPKTWKLSGEQKKILDYNCQKAVLQDTSRVVEAWFTPQIPVAVGPAEFSDLPGLILEIDIDHGNRTIAATNVELKPLPKDALEKPAKGKAVTKEEFKKIQDEKMKEMNVENGGSGGMRVIIRN